MTAPAQVSERLPRSPVLSMQAVKSLRANVQSRRRVAHRVSALR